MNRIELYDDHGQQKARLVVETKDAKGKIKRGKVTSLGKVISQTSAGTIYWNSKRGYFFFDPETLAYTEVPKELLPKELLDQPKDQSPLTESKKLYSFGDIYFVDRLFQALEYQPVLDTLNLAQPEKERLLLLLYFYLVAKDDFSQAQNWFNSSYAKFSYPQVDLEPNLCQATLEFLGQEENVQAFGQNHLKYVADLILSPDDEEYEDYADDFDDIDEDEQNLGVQDGTQDDLDAKDLASQETVDEAADEDKAATDAKAKDAAKSDVESNAKSKAKSRVEEEAEAENIVQGAYFFYVTHIRKYLASQGKYGILVLAIDIYTCLPFAYFLVPEDTIAEDLSTRLPEELQKSKFTLTAIVSDSEDHPLVLKKKNICKKSLTHIVYIGLDFVQNIVVDLDLLAECYRKNWYRLGDPDQSDCVRYKDNLFFVIELVVPIARDKETKELRNVYLYLCRNFRRHSTLSLALHDSNASNFMEMDDYDRISALYGLTCVITTEQMARQDVITILDKQQMLSQSLDISRLKSEDSDNLAYLYGHLTINFLANFLRLTIKNRLKVAKCDFVRVLENLFTEKYSDHPGYQTQKAKFLLQVPVDKMARYSVDGLLATLRQHQAKSKKPLIELVNINEEIKKIYATFGMSLPVSIHNYNSTLKVRYLGKPKVLDKTFIFAQYSGLTLDDPLDDSLDDSMDDDS